MHIHSQRQRDRQALQRCPVADTDRVHGICLLRGKSDVGHFPSREKYNNTRKRQHRGNVPSGSSSSVQNINKGERSAWRSGPQSTEAESLVARLLGPQRPYLEVTSCPALEEIIEGKGPSHEKGHRKQGSGFSLTHSYNQPQNVLA